MPIEINVINVLETFSYIGLFSWFLLFDAFIPLPEELVLLSIGYVSSAGYLNLFIAGFLAMFAFLLIDNSFFYLAKIGSKFISKFEKRASKKIFLKYKSKMIKNMPKMLLILTFIPRIRFFGPIFAGIIKVDWKRFLFYDALALLIYVSFYVSLGYFFHSALDLIMEEINRFQHIIFYITMIVIGGILVYFINKYFIKRQLKK